MLHLITYDLHFPGQDYAALHKEIAKFPHAKLTESCWIIKTNMTAYQLRSMFIPCVDNTDRLFICDFHSFSAFGFPENVFDHLTR